LTNRTVSNYKILHNKGKNAIIKRKPTEWKTIISGYSSDKGLILKGLVYKYFQKSIPKRSSNPINELANELNRQFPKNVQMTNKYMQKSSTPLAIEEMKSNWHWHFNLSQSQWQSSKQTKQVLVRVQGKRNTHSLLIGSWISVALLKSVCSFLKTKLKIRLPYDPVIPPLGIHMKQCKAE
jgi:hypothetical protein